MTSVALLVAARERPAIAVLHRLQPGLEDRRADAAKADTQDAYDSASKALAPSLRREDPQLAEVVAAWPGLPVAVTAGIVAMVRAAGRAQDGD